jgi:predicted dehydrogenase
MNQSIHTIDLLQWYMGPVLEVTAFTGCLAHKRIEVEDTAVVSLRFKNGALGIVVGTTAAFPGLPRKVEISGSNGTIFLEDSFITKWDFRGKKSYDNSIIRKFGTNSGGRKLAGAADPKAIDYAPHQFQFENFVNALNKKEKLLVDGNEARKSVEIILAVYKSVRTGKIVRL